MEAAGKVRDKHKLFEGMSSRSVGGRFPMFEWNEEEQALGGRAYPFRRCWIPICDKLAHGTRRAAGQVLRRWLKRATRRFGLNLVSPPATFSASLYFGVGLTDEEAKAKFGFFCMEALEFGAPPHGGYALRDWIGWMMLMRVLRSTFAM